MSAAIRVRMRWLALRSVCVLMACGSGATLAVALDEGCAITQYVHDIWTVDRGLPQNTVQAIWQTRDGYLWIGTQEGLARFDGVRFQVFDRGNTEAIQHNFMQALYEDSKGSLWIATYGGGLLRWKDGQWKRFTRRDGLLSDRILAIHEDGSGHLWVGTDGGLNRLRDGLWDGFTTGDGLPHNRVRVVYGDKRGGLWAGTMDGVAVMENGHWTRYQPIPELSHVSILIRRSQGVAVDRDQQRRTESFA